MDPQITGLRGLELGVPDLEKTAAFYENTWGLSIVNKEVDCVYLRATGEEHHVLKLRQRPTASLLAVDFAITDRRMLHGLHDKAIAFGANVTQAPEELAKNAGGGLGFAMKSPEGLDIRVSSNVSRHAGNILDPSKPSKLSHVVINSADVDSQMSFFMDLLGFRVSDSTSAMEFIRCCRDHHSVALARGTGASLNHMAYDMQDIDGIMRGSGRLKQSGFEVEWGLGRHGPGDNVFSYFVEPNGFVAEYTTEVQQIDELTHEPGDAEYWANYPQRPCRWGMATRPSDRVKRAFAGLDLAHLPSGESCEDIITKKMSS